MRPKMSVRAMSRIITPTLSASTAGRNCSFAIHENQVWVTPVKSRNIRVMHTKKMMARVNLILRTIFIKLFQIVNELGVNIGIII